jgi:hypothetical protein
MRHNTLSVRLAPALVGVLLVLYAGALVAVASWQHVEFTPDGHSEPTAFLELFFTQQDNLPEEVMAGQNYVITFRVVSHYQQDRDISYEVMMIHPDKTELLDQDTLYLVAGGQQDVTVHFTANHRREQSLIVVRIPAYDQYISFRVAYENNRLRQQHN